jgi:hypothetical protein
MSEAVKAGRGRPVGKKVKWSGIVWHSMTNAQIALAVGTSVPNVWCRRARLLKEGKKVAYQGKPYTHYDPSKPKRKRTAKKTAEVAAQ